MIIGNVRDWHNPKAFIPERADFCPHNLDIARDCTCKRPVVRKPYKVARVTDSNCGIRRRAQIVAEIHPNGRLVLRELGRRHRVETTLGAVYESCVMHEARRVAAEKRKARRK
jgi:hypothetical protein